jgi:hypothetical protein
MDPGDDVVALERTGWPDEFAQRVESVNTAVWRLPFTPSSCDSPRGPLAKKSG